MKTIQFRDFIILQRGFDLPKYNRDEGEYPVIAATGIHGSHSEFKVNPPGVVTGRSGSLGEVVFVERPYWPLNTTLWVKDFKGNKPRYVYYFLKTLDLKRFNSGAGVPTLNRNHLDTLVVKIHDRQNQQKIASILSAYDDLIENNLQRIKILEEIGQTLFREWFVKFRFPGNQKVKMVDSPLGEIPEGWEIVKFGDITTFQKGRKPQEVFPNPTEEMFPHLLIDFLRGGVAEYCKQKGMVTITDDDTVMVMDGSGSCDVFIGFSGAIGSTLGSYQSLRKSHLSPYSLYLFLLNRQDELKAKNVGAAVPHANKEYINKMEIVIPTVEVNRGFEEHIRPLFHLRSVLRDKNTILRQTRDLLLPKLISGELDVSELDITIPEASA